MQRLLTFCTLMIMCAAGVLNSALPPENAPTLDADTKSLVPQYTEGPPVNKQVITTSDGRSIEVEFSADGLAQVIVKIKGEPLGRVARTLKADAMTGRLSAMKEAHRRVLARLSNAEISSDGDIGAKAAKQQDKHEYFLAFNGFSSKVSPNALKKLLEDPDVEAVYPDDEVKVARAQSVPLINADDVWRLGNTGQGVTVAVVDTGIDYNHTDLGGGFGPSYTVIGGYDFANKDADPMDDHGHGTHVAGIIGGNGTVKGVAPGVKFLAYKAIGAGGSGLTSDVVAGIERAMNPDGDVTTDDAADIINLSINTEGAGISDPSAQAVETASNAGVLCVCAAGNVGSPWTVYSPGCAPSALTVGATDKLNVIASFSSTGPSTGTDMLKPDVVAPGKYITSCKNGGGYQSLSGTSMATPHAAGVAALVKSIHPDWTPAMVKAAVMQGAKDLGQPYLSQGAGRVDALKSVNLSTLILPSSLSLGTITTAEPIWQQHRDLTIQNVSSTDQTYDLSGSFTQQGITVTVTPSQITIPAGSSAQVGVDVSVDNSLVPEPATRPFAYYGSVVASSTADKIMVPMLILKSAVLQLKPRQWPSNLTIHNKNGYNAAEPYQTSYICQNPIWIPSGVYDIALVSIYDSRVLVKENVEVKGACQFAADFNEAIYSTTTSPRDRNGNPLTNSRGYYVVEHIPTGKGVRAVFGSSSPYYMPATIRTNAFSTDYRLVWNYRKDISPTEWYSFNYHRDGIGSNLTVTNLPTDLRHMTFHYTSPTKTGQLAVLRVTAECIMENRGPVWYPSFNPSADLSVLSPPYNQEVYYIPDNLESGPLLLDQMQVYDYTGSTLDVYSAPVLSESAKIAFQNPANYAGYIESSTIGSRLTQVCSLATDYMPMGSGPQLWFGKFLNTSTSVAVENGVDDHRRRSFYSPYFEFVPNEIIPVSIYKGAQLYSSDAKIPALKSASGRVYYDINFLTSCSSDVYTVQFERGDWHVAGKQGKTSVSATFDLRKNDRNPPYLTRYMVTSNGRPTEAVTAGADNRVTFKMVDDDAVSQAKLYCSTGDGNWIEMPVAREGDSFCCIIPDLPTESYVTLRINATDISGNSLTMDLAPAFYYGSLGIRGAKSNIDAGFIRLESKPVTAVFPDALYVEEPNRTSGIKVVASNSTLRPGDLVNLSGVAIATDGEVAISPSDISRVGTAAIPSPLAMPNLSIGGGKCGQQPAVENWRSRPIPGTNPVAYDRTLGASSGLNNIGLLTRTWGTVTYVGSGYFYINDGSGIDDGDPAVKGIRVDGVCPGVVGSKVAVTGISSCMINNTHIVRRIRTRNSADIAVIAM